MSSTAVSSRIKGEDEINLSALEWCRRINALPPEVRDNREWGYLLLTDKDFYAYRSANGTFKDICQIAELTESGLKGEFLF